MSSPETIDVLNRVLAVLRQSFLQYARYTHPYIPGDDSRAMQVIDNIVAEQDALAERVRAQIVAAGAPPEPKQFPMEFTDTHDLGIDYLVQEAIGYQKQDIAELQRCANSSSLAPLAHTLAAEALGMAKEHLRRLEELAAEKEPAER